MRALEAVQEWMDSRFAEEPDTEETPEFYQRLTAIVDRARVAQIDDTRIACGIGPEGVMCVADTTALVHLNDRLLEAA